ncbi:taste receptor type 2 member 134-like [Trichosurus vulpecula]|uniref:taste receptor type 2 member 134-like n=1 Tax=Trichosurus vulpecula TaxID=9337 RepID=UPI00186AC139|nr:taste receptor type 2 member 134-like [Trichosurus vulpecula]
MPSPLILFLMIFFLLECTIGIIENSFIIIVLGREWVQCWTLLPGDMILASLSISRFFLQGAAVFSNFFSYFFLTSRKLYIDIFWNFANTVSFWFTTWLAVFYCVKISSFTHPIFLWLKWRISGFVPWLLLWSLVICILIFILSFVKTSLVFQLPVTGNYSEKTTFDDVIRAFQSHFLLPLQMFILLIPFLFFLASTILLISSLCRHLRNMQHRSAGPQHPSMQVHVTTVKSLFFFLILYALYVLPIIISLAAPISVCSSHYWVWEIVIYSGISIHSAFLILNSSKLRRALKKMLHYREAA